MQRLIFLALAIAGGLLSCATQEQPASLFGEWRATAIHLPEPYTSLEGKDRLDIDEYGSARLRLSQDSTYESNIKLTNDLRVKRPMGPTEVVTTLWQGKFTSQQRGKFIDSAGYLILQDEDFVSSSRHELHHGVLVTTTSVKGNTFQIIWEKED